LPFRRVKLNRRLLCAAALGLLPLSSGAQYPALAAAIEARLGIATPAQDLALRGENIAASRLITDFYARREFAPAWTRTRDVDDLLRAIRDSADEGLDPADYHFSALVRLRGVVSQTYATDVERADFELLLTDAIVRLGYHLWFGKVDPQAIDPGWNMNRTLPGLDPAAEIESALATGDLYAAIERARPTHPLYVGLKRELARFRRAALAGGWPELSPGPTLEPGALDARVPVLRRILVATGDLAEATSADAHAYDASLEAAVRRFQQRMGLGADGRVGAATQAELRVPVEDRIRQLRVNLDRGRVLLFQLPHDFVVVNIAGFEAYYVRGTEIVWRGRAQVGKPYRATPQYRSAITWLVFNPTWTVPPTIIRNDILPQAKRDPASITRRDLKVIDRDGNIIDPASVNWAQFSSGHIPYTLRQDPGPRNTLGRVKFMFPNPYNVYLHDTPSRALFEIDTRSTSSGCVRLERPLELARLLLDDPERWSDAAIAATVARGELRNVTLPRPVPVMLAYWTAWVDAQARVNFRRDIYGLDAAWARALDARFAFRRAPIG
jgi:murein L,D-transpeptidase YcbB/YkuD